jgi:hypothetical protein
MIEDPFQHLILPGLRRHGIFNYRAKWCVHVSPIYRGVHVFLTEDAREAVLRLRLPLQAFDTYNCGKDTAQGFLMPIGLLKCDPMLFPDWTGWEGWTKGLDRSLAGRRAECITKCMLRLGLLPRFRRQDCRPATKEEQQAGMDMETEDKQSIETKCDRLAGPKGWSDGSEVCSGNLFLQYSEVNSTHQH